MSRYEKITYSVHPKLNVVDISFQHKKYDGANTETLNPTKTTVFGADHFGIVELDESDVREIHAKLGKIIAGWDA
jgi:hypothetical protein